MSSQEQQPVTPFVETPYDRALDRVVDTQNVPYAVAREILGPEPEVASPDAATVARLADHAENTRIYNLTGPVTLSPEEIHRNSLGIRAARLAVNHQTQPEE